MKPRLRTLPQKSLRVLVRCILGLLLITLIQTGNSAAAGPTNDEARTINAGIAETLKNTYPTDPSAAHPLSANPPSRRPESADSPATGLPQPQVKATLRSSPVMFIENVGQFDQRARFQVRGGPGTMWLAEDAIWITVVERSYVDPLERFDLERLGVQRASMEHEDEQSRGVNLKLTFPGANSHPRIEPFGRLDTKVSYFIGSDPDQWRADVPVWAGGRYVDLYPGVDLELASQHGRWTWQLACRINCSSALQNVRLRVEGAEELALDGENLRFTTAVGEFTLSLLEAMAYDGTPLDLAVTQPALTGNEIRAPPFDPTHNGAWDAFVARLNTAGTALEYATFLGGGNNDWGYGIAVDGAGRAYVTGDTGSADFPATPGAFDPSHNGSYDAFVARLSADGTALEYATFLGGGSSDSGYGIAVDGADRAYVTGVTWSADFPATPGAFDTSHNGYYDAFVARLNTAGTALEYATFLSGGYGDGGRGIAVAGAGSAYVTGDTGSADFPATPGAFDTSYNGGRDAFVAKLAVGGEAEPTYSIAGQVIDDAGNPIPNTTINATGTANAPTTTAGDGTYTLNELPVGTYSVSASKAGYLFSPTSHTVTVPPNATGVDFTGTPTTNVAADPTNSSVAVSPDSVPANGTTEIQITVTLRDRDNNPVSGKVVQVLSSRGGQDTITQPATPTNTAGQTTAAIRSDTAGTAELTVLDLTDNVELAQKPTVTFTPYTPLSGDFIESVNRLADTTTQQLNNLDSTTAGIANEGTYFRLAIGQHLAEGVVNAAFGLMDIFGGLAQLNQADEALKLSRPGLLDGGWERLFFEQDPYIYKERLLQASLYDAMRAGRWRGVAGALAWGGPDFFAAHLRDTAIDQLAERAVKQAGQDIFALYPDGMLTIAYPSVQKSVQQANQLIDNQRSALLNNPPPLTRVEQDAYAYDLWRRQLVPFVLVQQAFRQYQTLQQVHQVHLIGSSSAIGELLLRLSANLLATGFFDGPGKILVGGGLGAFDTYMAAQKLDEAGQMYGLAVGAMNGVPLKLNQIPLNAVKGLGQVRLRETPDTVTGRIDAVVNRSRGSDRILGLGWVEEASYSDITVTNTSNSSEPATFYLSLSYLIDPGFLPASQFLYKEATTTLAPGETGTVRIYYKDGNSGVSPVDGSALTVEVLGANSTGLFFIDSFGDQWHPGRVQFTATNATTLSVATDTNAATDTTPTIDDPLASFVLSSPVTQQYEGQLWINNPFTDTITADVTQTLPADVTPIDLNGGVLDGSTVSWSRSVGPEASEPITYTFEFAGTPGELNNLPSAILSVTSPLDGQTYSVDSNAPEFQTLWPVALDRATPASVMPGIDATLPVTVTNLLDTSASGSVQLDVQDTAEAVVHTETQNFDVPAGDQQTLSFTLPATLAKGYYVVEGTLTAGGASTTAFIDTIQVGLTSPTLSYRVEPEGLVHPTDTLTYTLQVSNTTGVTLNNTVLTATIPVSTSIVAGSITGGGAIAGNEIQWNVGALADDVALSLSYQVTVNEDAVGAGVQAGLLESTSGIVADEVQSTPGPTLWNLVSLCGIIEGDVNCSCKVDSQDAQLLSAHWGEGVNDPTFEPTLDLDGNFETNVIDVMKAVVHWNETCPFGIGP